MTKVDECVPPNDKDKLIHLLLEDLVKTSGKRKRSPSASESRSHKKPRFTGGGEAACHAICLAVIALKLGMSASAIFIFYGSADEWLHSVLGSTCSKNPTTYVFENMARVAMFQDSCAVAAERYQKNLNTLIQNLGLSTIALSIASFRTYYKTVYDLVKNATGCEGTVPKHCAASSKSKNRKTKKTKEDSVTAVDSSDESSLSPGSMVSNSSRKSSKASKVSKVSKKSAKKINK
jgi:hypothetical protein